MIEVWIDGGCSPNPGPGSWAAYFVRDGGLFEHPFMRAGHECQTTNNRMELRALLDVLEGTAGEVGQIIVHTDSRYVHMGATEWLFQWVQMGTLEDRANEDLWRKVYNALKYVRVGIRKVGREEVDHVHRLAMKKRYCDKCGHVPCNKGNV